MFPSGYSSRYGSRQSMQDRSSSAGVSSSTSSSRPQQTQQLGSPPRPIPTADSNSRYQSLYEDIERELFAEPSSSSLQPDADAIPTHDSNSRYQSLYDDFAQVLSTAPGSSNSSSRQQSATQESTFRTPWESYSRYPGVSYSSVAGKWRAMWKDPALNRRVSLGEYATESEAIKRIEDYKASRGFLSRTNNSPGVYCVPSGKWVAKYSSQGKRVHVGTFGTQEEAARAIQRHRAARRLPPMKELEKKN